MASETTCVHFPRSEQPPEVAAECADAFRNHEDTICTVGIPRGEGPNSNEVLEIVRPDFEEIGFEIETPGNPIERPSIADEESEWAIHYKVDGYHEEYNCILEVERGQAWSNNAVHCDVLKAVVLNSTDLLCLAVPHEYGSERPYDYSEKLLENMYSTDRIDLPFDTILIGY